VLSIGREVLCDDPWNESGRMMTTQRQRLPNRRRAETFELEVGGVQHVASIGRYPNGRLGEIFITAHKAGSAADTAARDAAITASIALQFGANPKTIRGALCRNSSGSGPLGVVLDLLAEDPL
jgi:ribonucleoside-diphosphate reductase alpha chain